MQTVRLRWVVSSAVSGPSPNCEDRTIEGDDEWGVLKTTAIQWSGWDGEKHKTLPEEFWGLRSAEVRPGDIVVTKAGPRHRVGVSAYVDVVRPKVVVSGKMVRLRVDPSIVDPRFLNFCISTPSPQAYLDSCKTGMAEAQMNFSNDELLALRFQLPQLDEQRRIADYLQRACGAMNSLILQRERQATLIEEWVRSKAALLTGRVDAHAGMDGGFTPLKRVLKSLKTGATPATAGENFWAEQEEDGIPWYGPSDFGSRIALEPTAKRLASRAVWQGVVPRFSAGSVLVVGIGTIGKVSYLLSDGSGNQQITALLPKPEINGRFLAWQLWSAAEELRDLAPYTTMPILNNEFLRSFPIVSPPLRAQRETVATLDELSEKVDSLQSCLIRSNMRTIERRGALIAAAINGDFEVATASEVVK